MAIEIVKGDLFKHLPKESSTTKYMLPHVCNNAGKWGKGFVLALNKRLGLGPRTVYMSSTHKLGTVSYYERYDEGGIVVANMVAQTLTRKKRNLHYGALASCMHTVMQSASFDCAEILCPRFGSGLAGGNQKIIEELIEYLWAPYFKVTIFELE